MGLAKRRATREVAEKLTGATGKPWVKRGLFDTQLRVEGHVDGREVVLATTTYGISGGSPTATIYVPIEPFPGRLEAATGSNPLDRDELRPETTGDAAFDREIGVRTDRPGLARHLFDEELRRAVLARKFTIIRIEGTGSSIARRADPRPAAMRRRAHLSLYDTRVHDDVRTFLDAIDLALRLARRAEAMGPA